MTYNRGFRGFVVAFFVCMFGVMLCIGGVIEYLVRGDSSGAIFKLCSGIAIIVIARQCFDFYNFQMLHLTRKFKQREENKRQKRSVGESPRQDSV